MADTGVEQIPGAEAPGADGGQPAAVPVTPAAPAATGYSYKEDRSDWIPRHRLNENTSKFEQQIKSLQERLEEQDRRVKSVFGIENKTAAQKEADETRQALRELLPELQGEQLTKEEIAELREAAKAARETSISSWQRHAVSMVTDLQSQVAKGMGLDQLSPSQSRLLGTAYREAAQAAAIARQDDPDHDASNDFLARHERGDKTLIQEFAKAILDDWFEPAKRYAAASIARRNRPVPGGERTRTAPVSSTPAIDYNDEDAFKKALLDSRARG